MSRSEGEFYELEVSSLESLDLDPSFGSQVSLHRYSVDSNIPKTDRVSETGQDVSLISSIPQPKDLRVTAKPHIRPLLGHQKFSNSEQYVPLEEYDDAARVKPSFDSSVTIVASACTNSPTAKTHTHVSLGETPSSSSTTLKTLNLKKWSTRTNGSSIAAYFEAFNGREQPKEVCSNSKCSALGHFALFHMPSIIITLGLFFLYIAHHRWPAHQPNVNTLNALQFAAKFHETLIILSFTDILLHRICYSLLVHSDGVPLGFLSSPFHLSSPIAYLTSWEFWAACWRPGGRRIYNAMTGFVVIIIALLCIGAGPLSAIIMIPRQGWWRWGSHQHGSSFEDFRGVYYAPSPLYETNLDSRIVRIPERCFYDATNPNVCRDVNLWSMVQGLGPVLSILPRIPHMANITYTNAEYLRTERPITLSTLASENKSDWMAPLTEEVAYATSPMAFLVAALVSDHSLIDGFEKWLVKSEPKQLNGRGNKKWKQPLVEVHCSHTTWYSGEQHVDFTFKEKAFARNFKFDLEEDTNLEDWIRGIYARREQEYSGNRTDYRLQVLPSDAHPLLSASFLFGAAAHGFNFDDTESEGTDDHGVALSLCLASARWFDADLWIDPQLSSAAQSQFGSSFESAIDDLGDTSKVDDVIRMNHEWIESVGLDLNDRNQTAYEYIPQFCAEKDGARFFYYCLPVALITHLTDALSQPPVFDVYDADPSKGPNLTTRALAPGDADKIIHHTPYKHIYMYDFWSSRAIPYAFAALLLHVFIAFLHLVNILTSSEAWTGSSWAGFGQMLILALQSKAPDDLGDVGGGVMSSRTWRKMAKVMVVGDDGKLQIVLGERELKDEESDVKDMGTKGDEAVTPVKAGVEYR